MRKDRVLLLLGLAVAVLIIAGAVSTIRRGFNGREQPSAFESYPAKSVRSLAVPSRAKHEKNPFTPSPELLDEAKAHFAAVGT
jgi:hypothetical protein